MADECFEARDIFGHGWRQFSVCQPDDVAVLLAGCTRLDGAPLTVSDHADWWIVTSQSCDLTNGDLAKEPSCELLRAVPKPRKKTRANPDTIWAQSPREIALCNAQGEVLNATIHEGALVPRGRLQGIYPCSNRGLHERHKIALRKWLAGRYSRPAFPGVFNDRLKPGESALENFLVENESFIRRMYCRVLPEDDEVAQGQKYTTQWILVYPHARLDSNSTGDLASLEEEAEARAETLARRWEELLTQGDIKGISAQVESKPDDRFSLADMENFRHWDKDFISMQADDGVLPPSGLDATP